MSNRKRPTAPWKGRSPYGQIQLPLSKTSGTAKRRRRRNRDDYAELVARRAES